jgi:hypothetical protein
MKKKSTLVIWIGLLLILTQKTYAQETSFGDTSVSYPSAIASFNSTTQGILPPRVGLTATNLAAPISSSTTGLLLYNNATTGSVPTNVTPGFYYWDTNRWLKFVTQVTGPFFDYSNAVVTTNALAFQAIPGISRTLNLNSGDRVSLTASDGMQANGVVYSSAEIWISVNGSTTVTGELPNGGYTRVSVDYYGTNYLQNQNWNIFGHYDVPSTGSYTFTVRVFQVAPSSGTAFIGGNNTSVLQAALKTEVYKP